MSDFLSRISHFSPKRLALLADDLQRRVETLESAQHAPIAIVGIGCRFPGGLNTPEQYWDFLCRGGDAIGEVPADRWDIDALYDPNPDAPGKMSTRMGGFLHSVDQFDPHFFGIAPREAQRMDPQQRLLLEVTWEAIEHAAINADELAETRASVFVGMSAGDYFQVMRDGGLESFDAYTASGSAHSIASGRLSYLLGLRGPSVSIDTACSSSLVAIHNAVQSLRRGESDLALAGGVNLILTPDVSVALSKAHMLAPDGRCKAFDARADGFVRGEGCGMLVLKRLSDARASNDRVIAVIRGSATNQDGRSNGLTAPNGPAQVAVLRDALANARLEPGDVDVIEAHGTGTSLGDPIEVGALATAFGATRSTSNPLLVGSVKANVGHLEAAAGVAGVIKMALALQHGVVPPQQHFSQPNPFIAWDELAVRVPTELVSWPVRDSGARIGGVSSFGFSGTNVHVLLEAAAVHVPSVAAESLPITASGSATDIAGLDAPVVTQFSITQQARPLQVLTISARSENARSALIDAYQHVLREGHIALPDVAYTVNTGRAAMPHRVAIVTNSLDDAIARLGEARAGNTSRNVVAGHVIGGTPRVALLFTGQGSQYPGMARALYESEPAFRTALDACAEILLSTKQIALLEILFADDAQSALLDDTAFTQPALFSVEYSLAAMWQSWGITPTALLGHSLGEIVAACVAGVMSLEDSLRLVTARGQLMSALPRDGSMVALFTDEARARALISTRSSDVSIAAVNGPENIVISGRTTAITAVVDRATALGIRTTRLNVSHAFHSPLMEPMLSDFERVAESIVYHAPTIDICSNVTGDVIGRDTISAAYWVRHVVGTVQFARGVQSLVNLGCTAFIEAGPHPTLISLAQQFVTGGDHLWLPTLRRDTADWQQALESVCRLYVRGATINWRAFDSAQERTRQVLPRYPFQRSRYWVDVVARAPETVVAKRVAHDRGETMLHPLVEREVRQAATSERIFESRLSTARFPYLKDHRIFGELLLPSPMLMEISRAVGAIVLGGSASIRDFAMHAAISVDDNREVAVQAIVGDVESDAAPIRIAAFDGDTNRWHTRATASLGTLPGQPVARDLTALQQSVAEPVDVGAYYSWLSTVELEFGARFRGILALWQGRDAALARVSAPATLLADGTTSAVRPAVLDSCFHVLGAALPMADRSVNKPFLLSHVESINVYQDLPSQFWAHAELTISAERAIELGVMHANMTLLSDRGEVLAELSGIQLFRTVDNPSAKSVSTPEPEQRVAVHTNVAPPAPAKSAESKDTRVSLPHEETSADTVQSTLKDTRAALPDEDTPPDTVQSMLHEIAWIEQTSAQGALPGTAEIRAAVKPSVMRIAETNNLRSYAQFSVALNDVTSMHIVHALRVLAGSTPPGATFTVSANPGDLGVLPKHRRLFARMIEILAEDGLVTRDGTTLRVVNALTGNIDAQVERLRQQYPHGDATITLTHRAGSELAGVLRGTVDPLSLLFPGGSLSEMERLYQSSPPARTYNELVSESVAAIGRDWSGKRPLRILEVGAGTGSTTAFVLPALAHVDFEYTFTDVSPLFLNRAREKFAAVPGMRYSLLDISADAPSQGMKLAHFDVVIGANVMHATADLLRTMNNVRALLVPDGLVVLLEGTTKQRFGDLTVGMLDGWWAYTDTKRRNYALMPRPQWLTLLREAGFASANVIVDAEDGPVLEEQAIFLAKAPAAAEAPKVGQRWLIVPDATGIATELSTQLSDAGADVTLIESSSAVELRASLTSALRAAHDAQQPYDGVLHLGAIAQLSTNADANTLWRRQQRTLESALCTVQVLAGSAFSVPPLWFITRGAQATSSAESADCAQAAVWGLSYAVSLEHPEVHCRRVDLDSTLAVESAVANLITALRAPSDEDQIALRGSQRLLRRLVHTTLKDPQPVQFNAARTYLITGGVRGLGLLVADWMVLHGARHVVLMSRNAPTVTAQQSIDALNARGANVVCHTGDVANETDVQRILAAIRETPHALAGIVHSAGVLDDGVVTSLNWSRFSTVMRPKVLGSWHLHRLAGPLDFLVLFSSGASVAGSAGQANHAAANAFEDALAWHRQALGQPTLSINWGPWSELGAAADRALSGPSFLRGIAPSDGLQALGRAMQRATPNGLFARAQVAVLNANWSNVGKGVTSQLDTPLFRQLAPVTARTTVPVSQRIKIAPAASNPPAKRSDESLRDRLRSTAPNRRQAALMDEVRTLTQKVLGIPHTDGFDVQEPLRQLGLDSLMSVELRNRLGRAAGTVLGATVTFDFPTVQALANHLATTVFADEFTSPAEFPAPIAPAAESDDHRFDALSDEELALRLTTRLDALHTEDFR